MKKYGLILDTPQPENYVFGASLPFISLQPDGDWTNSLPEKEIQNLNGIEPYACVTFTVLHCVEILIKRQYGIDTNYSDRFLATISGTKEGGNSPQVVCEFLRTIGVVPEHLWPFDETISSFEDFYAPLPQSLIDLAKDFVNTWDFKHEFVPNDPVTISAALQCSPLLISVPAWFKDSSTGLYYRPEGMVDNHATTLVYERVGAFRRIFDSYGDPFIKDIDWNVIPMQLKRFYVKKKEPVTPPVINLFAKIIQWVLSEFNIYKKFYASK